MYTSKILFINSFQYYNYSTRKYILLGISNQNSLRILFSPYERNFHAVQKKKEQTLCEPHSV